MSRRRVVVTGMGLVSPLGHTPEALHAALLAGESARKPIELFPTAGLGCREAGEIRPFAPHDWLGERNVRPLDRTGRLLVVAAHQALAASGWTAAARAATEVGLVVGTTFCSVRTIAEFDRRALQLGPSYASPLDFANSVINAAAGQAAIWHDLRGINSTVAAGEASGLLAIGCAMDVLRSGRSTALLAGGAEELCFESFLGHFRAGRLCGSQGGGAERPVPFDGERNGFSLSEGAALLVLEEAESAAARGAVALAEVAGHGAAFDPTRGGEGGPPAVARAVRLALADAGVEPAEVGVLSASASGSVVGDRNEALGVAEALGARAAELPVAAVKALLGEALGASGAFQAVDLVESMRRGTLPGVAGLETVEEGFPLPGAMAASRTLGHAERRIGLATSMGADGHCAAVVFGLPAAAAAA